LADIHEESSKTHFLDRFTRSAVIERLDPLEQASSIIEVGCSSGYLLEEILERRPEMRVVGIDYVEFGLMSVRKRIPEARLVQADCNLLPLPDGFADLVLSMNVLEHIPDDLCALGEMYRVLRAGGRAIIVVPLYPSTYDYYDKYLRHQRRYSTGELRDKAESVGFRIVERVCLGTLLFPAFWLAKKRNRILHGNLVGAAARVKVANVVSRTERSRVGNFICQVEHFMIRQRICLPFGIRECTVIEKTSSR
jgi:SAM-dependent methyltransferase